MELVRKEVEFHNSKLVGIQKDGKIYTPLKQFCDVLGVDYSSQLKRIKRDETLECGMDKIPHLTSGGEQEIAIIDISFLPLWLTGIKTNQCKREEAREFLLDFKLKAKDVLAEAFMGKPMIQEEPKQLEFDFDADEKKRDVCVNRLIGYVKEIIAYDEEIKRLNKEIKTRLSLIKLDSETYYDSLR